MLVGVTEEFFIVATDVINDLRRSRASILVTDIDTDIVDLELEWVVPNLHVIPVPVHNEHVLDVRGHNDLHRYFMVSTTRGNGSEKKIWTKWMKHLAKNSPVPDQFLQEIPKSKLSFSHIFHLDNSSSTEMVVKSSLISNKEKKSSSILNGEKKKSKKSLMGFRPFNNLLPVVTDLYDTTGIIKEKKKKKLSLGLCGCLPKKKKRVKD